MPLGFQENFAIGISIWQKALAFLILRHWNREDGVAVALDIGIIIWKTATLPGTLYPEDKAVISVQKFVILLALPDENGWKYSRPGHRNL